jgi:hypothetical protein
MRVIIRATKGGRILKRKPATRSESVTSEESLNPESAVMPSHEDIARLAHALWEARGSGDGGANQDWFEAERQLRAAQSKGQAA